jgi:hypothetical protein
MLFRINSHKSIKMKKLPTVLVVLLYLLGGLAFVPKEKQSVKTPLKKSVLHAMYDSKNSTISVHRLGIKGSILVQNVKTNHRPYLHPIVAPDGKGILTE